MSGLGEGQVRELEEREARIDKTPIRSSEDISSSDIDRFVWSRMRPEPSDGPGAPVTPDVDLNRVGQDREIERSIIR